MTPREKLQRAYELAFHPPTLDRTWGQIKRDEVADPDALVELLKMALDLHQALPESGYASHRALQRLALYQANSRQFGTVRFLRNILKRLGVETTFPHGTVPGHMIRDIGLPPFCRQRTGPSGATAPGQER